MTTATFTPAPSGATAATGAHHPHRVGNAVRAVRVFAAAAFSVVLLGDTDRDLYRDAGVVTRH
ncbi:hypothetical protein AB0J38_16910 [Streptomyces sp. NPDC050095]|uniref:hypothetical protein n=1 Tax=unclassified Streptomyces TaxID=2593676 RepID=UPI00342E110F